MQRVSLSSVRFEFRLYQRRMINLIAETRVRPLLWKSMRKLRARSENHKAAHSDTDAIRRATLYTSSEWRHSTSAQTHKKKRKRDKMRKNHGKILKSNAKTDKARLSERRQTRCCEEETRTHRLLSKTGATIGWDASLSLWVIVWKMLWDWICAMFMFVLFLHLYHLLLWLHCPFSQH